MFSEQHTLKIFQIIGRDDDLISLAKKNRRKDKSCQREDYPYFDDESILVVRNGHNVSSATTAKKAKANDDCDCNHDYSSNDIEDIIDG
jgi:hypothetical protein